MSEAEVLSPPEPVRLPRELVDFLNESYSQSLLVRGGSGVGKTTLGLSALSQFPGRRIYITTRVEVARLRGFFPWLDSVQPPIELVGVDSESENIHGVADALKVLRLRSSPGKAGPGSIAPTDRWAWLPPKLQEVWRSIGSEERNLVVIDSWDAFVGAYLGALAAPEERIPDQLEIERILLRAMTLVNAHLILIAERDRDAPLDYLVDGIVMLSMVTAGAVRSAGSTSRSCAG